MPGYDVKFTTPLDKSFECPICWNALRDPVQVTPCGHRVCQSCLEPIMRNKKPKCPLDNLPLNGEKIFPDNGCLRQVLALEVFCKQHKEGCQWTGPLSDSKTHEKECGFVDIECPRSCGVFIKKREKESHNEECACREVSCHYCHRAVTLAEQNSHLEICPKLPIDCPWECGTTNITREMCDDSTIDTTINIVTTTIVTGREQNAYKTGNCKKTIVVHKLEECSCSVLLCKYSNAGCTFKGKKEELAVHLENTMEEHLNLVHKTLVKQQKCLEAQNDSIQLQKEHIKLQREALMSYKNDLLELRSKFADGEFIWKISNISQKLRDSKTRIMEPLISEPFYTHKNGYKMCAGLWLNGFGSGKGTYISVGLQVVVGEYDDILRWPVNPKFTFILLDQRENAKDRRNITASFDPHWIARPTPERQLGKGARKFVLQSVACGNTFCKNDAIFIRFIANTATRNP